MKLHGYFRSTASWRVRIVLGLKQIDVDQASYQLRNGEQRSAAYLAINPQGLVPALELDDGRILTQSLAICEYLNDLVPDPPLLSADPVDRAQARSVAQLIACDVHPVQNLKILSRLSAAGLNAEAVTGWARTTIVEGLDAYEQQIARTAGVYSLGDTVTLADVCLVPQLGNARRFGVDMNFPRILAIEQACKNIPAFAAAVPDGQYDAQ